MGRRRLRAPRRSSRWGRAPPRSSPQRRPRSRASGSSLSGRSLRATSRLTWLAARRKPNPGEPRGLPSPFPLRWRRLCAAAASWPNWRAFEPIDSTKCSMRFLVAKGLSWFISKVKHSGHVLVSCCSGARKEEPLLIRFLGVWPLVWHDTSCATEGYSLMFSTFLGHLEVAYQLCT